MSGTALSESTVEAVSLDWLVSLGWAVLHGADLAPDGPGAERADTTTLSCAAACDPRSPASTPTRRTTHSTTPY